MKNGLKSNEWQRIWVQRALKSEIQKGRPNNSDILQNWFLLEIRSPFLICRKFKNLRKAFLIHAEWTEI